MYSMFVVLEGVQHGGLQGKNNTRTKKNIKLLQLKMSYASKESVCRHIALQRMNFLVMKEMIFQMKWKQSYNRKLLCILLNWPKLQIKI